METRVKLLQERLRRAVVVEAADGAGVLAFGQTAEVLDEGTDITHTWRIVGSTEADLGAGLLSVQSPVAKALLGRTVGDRVEVPTPRGPRRLRIKRLL